MKALSLWRPWGELIAAELKRVETRDWTSLPRCLYGQRIAIHAAKKIDHDAASVVMAAANVDISGVKLSPGGVIVCTAVVHAIEWLDDSDYWRLRALCDCDGKVGICLTKIRRLRTPVPFTGRQRIFNVPDDLLGA